MKVLILGSGAGKRLYPITKITTKVLIDIKGKPLLAYILEKLEKSKIIDEIYITYDNHFEDQFKKFIEHFKYTKKIELITNKEISGSPSSIGTISSFVKLKNIKEDLLVLAGDSIFSFEIDDFIDFYKKHNETSIAIYDIRDKKKAAGKYGIVELDENHKLLSFEEKPDNPKTSLAATLCYILSNYDLHHLDKNIFRENAGELIAHLVKHEGVYGYIFEGKWFDIGNIDDLERARKEF